jgi:amino acid permease
MGYSHLRYLVSVFSFRSCRALSKKPNHLDLNIPLFIALYFGWKIFKRTKVWKASEMDFWTGIPSIEETEGDYVPPRTTLGKIADTIL